MRRATRRTERKGFRAAVALGLAAVLGAAAGCSDDPPPPPSFGDAAADGATTDGGTRPDGTAPTDDAALDDGTAGPTDSGPPDVGPAGDGGGTGDAALADGGSAADSGGSSDAQGGEDGPAPADGGGSDAPSAADGGGSDAPSAADGGGSVDAPSAADGGGSVDAPAGDAGTTLTVASPTGVSQACAPGTPLNVKSLVSGGVPPLSCSVYQGPGQGTTPAGLTVDAADPSGCTLVPAFGSGQLPGVYGFLVTVRDSTGQSIEVPVACQNGACPASAVSVSPALWPPRLVATPGQAYRWTVTVSDLDAPCTDSTCAKCSWCTQASMSTLGPLTIASNLDCTSPGDVCLDNMSAGAIATCPDVLTWTAEPRIKAHSPLRPAAEPAWTTMELSLTYSGAQVSPTCGSKTWACHWEALEWNRP